MDYAIHSMKGSLLHVLAYVIGGAMLLGMILCIGDSGKTAELWNTLKYWGDYRID
ncbi:hypothetical protein RWE15_08535 [Virgibacillus halophilus]|uniref:Uncharacterized protein n=1 Tax=Tigheibacillus halophilus TaxID=361280 RepID=A0ABU5C6L7_9BACI|nr:hypothetical protein [Virgibacillus halophilus]